MIAMHLNYQVLQTALTVNISLTFLLAVNAVTEFDARTCTVRFATDF
jgi:hypothetical protein